MIIAIAIVLISFVISLCLNFMVEENRHKRTETNTLNLNLVAKNENQFSVSDYLEKIEKLHTKILLEREEQKELVLELWWGLDGIAIYPNGTTKTLSKRPKKEKQISYINLSSYPDSNVIEEPVKSLTYQNELPFLQKLLQNTEYRINNNINGTYQVIFYIPYTQIKCSVQVLSAFQDFKDFPNDINVIDEYDNVVDRIFIWQLKWALENKNYLCSIYMDRRQKPISLPDFRCIYYFQSNYIINNYLDTQAIQNQIQGLQNNITNFQTNILQTQQNCIIAQNLYPSYLSCCCNGTHIP